MENALWKHYINFNFNVCKLKKDLFKVRESEYIQAWVLAVDEEILALIGAESHPWGYSTGEGKKKETKKEG